MLNFLILTSTYYIDFEGNKHNLNIDLYKRINEICLNNGSSLLGRIEALKYSEKVKYKLPIIVDDNGDNFLICTRSIKADDCIVINGSKLLKCQRKEYQSSLTFKNNIILFIDIDYRIIKRQLKIIHNYRLKRLHKIKMIHCL